MDIGNRDDVELLVNHFYKKVLDDTELGYFFSDAVHNWVYHQKKFVDYWQSVILNMEVGEKSPLSGDLHIHVDDRFSNSFNASHFRTWIRLFNETVDELFHGPNANWAKESARKMADNIYKKMFFGRKLN